MDLYTHFIVLLLSIGTICFLLPVIDGTVTADAGGIGGDSGGSGDGRDGGGDVAVVMAMAIVLCFSIRRKRTFQ